jgi:hypothetical protein
VVSRIVEEAQREGTPLSELERKIKDVLINNTILDGNAMRSRPTSVVSSLHEDETPVAVERNRYRCPRNSIASLLVLQRTSIPELEQSRAVVLNTLASVHSRRSYEDAIERFIAWYCARPRLAFNRSAAVQYRDD